MKYLVTIDSNNNGDSHSAVFEGDTPESAFEKWYLEEYHGCEWDDLNLDTLNNELQGVMIYRIIGEPIEFDFQAFIAKHDTRSEQEKDPDYEEYMRLKNKFEANSSSSTEANRNHAPKSNNPRYHPLSTAATTLGFCLIEPLGK